MTLYLSESDVEQHLTMGETIERVEYALGELGEKRAQLSPRMRIESAEQVLNILSAGLFGQHTFGFKAYTTFKDGTRAPSTLIHLYDSETGNLDAIVQGALLTRMRTGAASAIATKHLARENSHVLGLIGAGRIGEMQLVALLQDKRFTKVIIYDAVPEAKKRLMQVLINKFAVECVEASDAIEVLNGADVLTTATFSNKPIVNGNQLRTGTHVNAVGANSPTRAELDETCMERSRVVAVDFKEQSKFEAGDLIKAVDYGKIGWDQIIELPDIVAGNLRFDRNEEDITIFKSIGIAIEDIAVAKYLCTKVRKKDIGTEIPVN